MTPGPGDGQEPELAGLDLRLGRGDGHEAQRQLVAQQVLHHRRLAFVGHMDHAGVVGGVDVLRGDVAVVADGHRAVGQLAFVALEVLHQLRRGVHRHAGMHCQHHRHRGEQGHEADVAVGVVGHFLEQEGRCDHLGHTDDAECVAVGC